MSGRNVVVGGTNDQENLYFAVCQMASGFKMVNSMDLGENKFGRPFKLKRLSGHDIYVVGCVKHILMIKLANGRLQSLKVLQDIHADLIFDLCVVKNMIFSKGKGESFIRVTYFGDQFNTVAKVKDDSSERRPEEVIPQMVAPNPASMSQATVSHFEVPMCTLS